MTPVSHPMGSFVGVIHVLQPVNYNRLYLVTVNSIIDYVSLLLIYIYFIYCWVIIIILSCKAIVIYIYIYMASQLVLALPSCKYALCR